MNEAVLGRVATCLRDYLDLEIARFSRATVLADYELGAEDVDLLLCLFEMEFGIDLDDVDAELPKTVGDLCDVVETKLGAVAA